MNHVKSLTAVLFVLLSFSALHAEEPGFEFLFDGKTLQGWEGDLDVWRIDSKSGSMVANGRGNIFTKEKYDNFIVQLEFKVAPNGNNGLMIRVDDSAFLAPSNSALEVQIDDDRQRIDDFNGVLERSGLPAKRGYSREPGEWNFLEVVADGARYQTFLNGMTVVDADVLGSGNRLLQSRAGRFGFLSWDGMTAIRLMRVKPIKAGTSQSYKSEPETGFEPLFDGKSLENWGGDTAKWKIEDDVLVHRNGGDLFTKESYDDFILRFETKLSKDSVDVLRLCCARPGKSVPGIDVKIVNEDDFSPRAEPTSFYGSIPKGIPARRGSLKKTGSWNSNEIVVRGSLLTVVVNDKVVMDTDLRAVPTETIAKMKKYEGHLRLLGGKGVTEYRNIRIKRLNGDVTE